MQPLKVTFKFGLADNPIVRNRKSKDRQYNGKKDKGQTMIDKTPQKKSKTWINTNLTKTGDESRCSKSISCLSSDTRVTFPYIGHRTVCSST